MPERKARLGRGLAELLGEGRVEGRSRAVDGPVAREAAAAGETAEQPPRSAAELPVSLLRPNPRQPRRDMDRSGLEELAESMRSLGIVQPISCGPRMRDSRSSPGNVAGVPRNWLDSPLCR